MLFLPDTFDVFGEWLIHVRVFDYNVLIKHRIVFRCVHTALQRSFQKMVGKSFVETINQCGTRSQNLCRTVFRVLFGCHFVFV